MENLENKYTDLDKFFQDKLGGYDKMDSSWKIPPIDVLDNAIGTINLNKKKRRKRNLLYLLLLLSIALTLLVIRNSVNLYRIQQKVEFISEDDKSVHLNKKNVEFENKKPETLEKQQTNTKLTNQVKQTSLKDLANNNETQLEEDKRSNSKLKSITNNTSNQKQNNLTKNTNKQSKSTETSNQVKQKTTAVLANNNETQIEVDKTSNNKLIPIIDNVVVQQQNKLATNSKKQNELAKKQNKFSKILNQNQQQKTKSSKLKTTNFEFKSPENIGLKFNLPDLPFQNKSIHTHSKDLNNIANQFKISAISLLPMLTNQLENADNLQLASLQNHLIKNEPKAKLWTVYAFSGINLMKQWMTNLPSNPGFTLTEYDKNYIGLESGAGLQYQFSPKFNVNLSLGYSEINNKCVYADETEYDSDNESTNIHNITTYKSDYSIETTALAYESSYNFEVKDRNITQINNETHISQKCQSLKTSIGVEYIFLSKNNFTFKLGLGGGVNYLMKAAHILDINILNGNTSLYRSDATMASTKDMNRWLLFGLGTASLNYKISQKISVGLRNEFAIDLNSSRKTNSKNDPKTYSRGLRTVLTAGYNF